MRVLLKISEHQFVVVDKNCKLQEALYSVSSQKICVPCLQNSISATTEFVEWIIEHKQVDADFLNKVMFSDEAHFHLDSFVNRQNCRIWVSENPYVIVEKQMHPQRVTVWCGFRAGGIIGPYFFENEAG